MQTNQNIIYLKKQINNFIKKSDVLKSVNFNSKFVVALNQSIQIVRDFLRNRPLNKTMLRLFSTEVAQSYYKKVLDFLKNNMLFNILKIIFYWQMLLMIIFSQKTQKRFYKEIRIVCQYLKDILDAVKDSIGAIADKPRPDYHSSKTDRKQAGNIQKCDWNNEFVHKYIQLLIQELLGQKHIGAEFAAKVRGFMQKKYDSKLQKLYARELRKVLGDKPSAPADAESQDTSHFQAQSQQPKPGPNPKSKNYHKQHSEVEKNKKKSQTKRNWSLNGNSGQLLKIATKHKAKPPQRAKNKRPKIKKGKLPPNTKQKTHTSNKKSQQ